MKYFLMTEEVECLEWLLEIAEEWTGSYLPQDPALAFHLEKLQAAKELVEKLKD